MCFSERRWSDRLQSTATRECGRPHSGDARSFRTTRRWRCVHKHQVHGSHLRIVHVKLTSSSCSCHLQLSQLLLQMAHIAARKYSPLAALNWTLPSGVVTMLSPVWLHLMFLPFFCNFVPQCIFLQYKLMWFFHSQGVCFSKVILN